jgi:hypothetical protein
VLTRKTKPVINDLGFGLLLGLLLGTVLTLMALVLIFWLLTGAPEVEPPVAQAGVPDMTLTLSRDAIQHMVDESLDEVAVPLVTLHDPSVELEPDAVVVLRVRGDTVLLGSQLIVLRMRVIPAGQSVNVVTEAADVGGRFNIAGPLTQQLDDQINAQLTERFSLGEKFEVLNVDSTTDAMLLEARVLGS